MLDYYDRILLGIAVSLGGGWVVALLTAIPTETALLGGAILAAPLVVDALFRNPPTQPAEPYHTGVLVLWVLHLSGGLAAIAV
ncbi:MAG: hypothetical protein ACQETB_03670 [Halobacteriota archaeon]